MLSFKFWTKLLLLSMALSKPPESTPLSPAYWFSTVCRRGHVKISNNSGFHKHPSKSNTINLGNFFAAGFLDDCVAFFAVVLPPATDLSSSYVPPRWVFFLLDDLSFFCRWLLLLLLLLFRLAANRSNVVEWGGVSDVRRVLSPLLNALVNLVVMPGIDRLSITPERPVTSIAKRSITFFAHNIPVSAICKICFYISSPLPLLEKRRIHIAFLVCACW